MAKKNKNKGKNNKEVMILKGVEVVYAALTGKGVKNEKAKKHQYSLGVLVDKKTMKEIIKKANDLFEEHATCGDEPEHDPKNWFKKEEDGDGYVFWLNCAIDEDTDYPLVRQRANGTSYGYKEFETMGKGSVVDVKFAMYLYDCGVGRALNAVKLIEYVPYEGGGLEGGESIDVPADHVTSADDDETEELLAEIEEAIDDEDKETAKKLLKKLDKSHPKFKKLKKAIKAL